MLVGSRDCRLYYVVILLTTLRVSHILHFTTRYLEAALFDGYGSNKR